MKRWTLGGLTIIGICCAALTMRMGCQVDLTIRDDVTPVEHRHGWNEELAQSKEARRLVDEMPDFEIRGVKRDNRKSNVRLWEYCEHIHVPNYRQEIGDCVSFGAANAIDYLQRVQLALGKRHEFQSAYEPYIYGTSRVQIGGGQLGNSDGSIGAWAAKAVQQYGVLSVEADGVPDYAGTIAKQWGYRGPPEKFLEVGKQALVKTVSPMRSADDVRDAICNGYPVTIASNAGFGSIRERDGRQVGEWTTSWAHQMCIIGYDGSTNAGPWYYVLNSWGPRAHPEPLQGEPAGGFWVSERAVDRIVSQGDSFAFSSFEGFPAQEIDDFNVLRQAGEAQFLFPKEVAMFVFGLAVAACVLIVLCRVLKNYRKGAGVALALLMISGSAAHAIEFDVMAEKKNAVPSFDVMAAEPRSTEGMDFAVLKDPCRCAVTGECDCDEGECNCEGCPVHQDQEQAEEVAQDDRPVITVRTMPGCAPCSKAKSQSKELDDYRFVFVEQGSVHGGAPRVEWQGSSGKWAFNGWNGADFFERAYRRSQGESVSRHRAKRRHHYRRRQPQSIRWAPSNCYGGSCRTFR